MTMVRIRAFHGLRGLGAYSLPDYIAGTLTPANPKVVAALAQRAAGLPTDAYQAISAASMEAASRGGLPDGGQTDKCACLVERAAQAAAEMGQVLDGAARADAVAECTIDAVAFESLLNQVGIDTKGCVPWYKQSRTWIIGGAVVAAGGLLLWSAR